MGVFKREGGDILTPKKESFVIVFYDMIMTMKVTFDPNKNQANFEKHGLFLNAADEFCWGSAFYQEDTRKDYGEKRYYVLGFLHNRLHAAIFTPRPDGIRMISLRKANAKEIECYENQTRP